MSLQARIEAARGDHRRAGRILRRARALYIRFVWPDIKADLSGSMLRFCAGRMLEAGMYALPKGERDVRFAILRRAWKNETGGPSRFGHADGWFHWLNRNGFTAPEFDRRKKDVA